MARPAPNVLDVVVHLLRQDGNCAKCYEAFVVKNGQARKALAVFLKNSDLSLSEKYVKDLKEMDALVLAAKCLALSLAVEEGGAQVDFVLSNCDFYDRQHNLPEEHAVACGHVHRHSPPAHKTVFSESDQVRIFSATLQLLLKKLSRIKKPNKVVFMKAAALKAGITHCLVGSKTGVFVQTLTALYHKIAQLPPIPRSAGAKAAAAPALPPPRPHSPPPLSVEETCRPTARSDGRPPRSCRLGTSGVDAQTGRHNDSASLRRREFAEKIAVKAELQQMTIRDGGSPAPTPKKRKVADVARPEGRLAASYGDPRRSMRNAAAPSISPALFEVPPALFETLPAAPETALPEPLFSQDFSVNSFCSGELLCSQMSYRLEFSQPLPEEEVEGGSLLLTQELEQDAVLEQ